METVNSFVHLLLWLTEFSGSFDINVVKTWANPDNYTQAFELFQIVSGQSDGMVEKGSDCLV